MGHEAFAVVQAFERALARYTGAPEVVAVDSCTNALFLSLGHERTLGDMTTISLPRRTYVGVAHAVLNAGLRIEWRDVEWEGMYELGPVDVWDSAKRLTAGMWRPGSWPARKVCLSFQAYKHLPIGRGGAILTDDPEAAAWLRRARHDGRDPDHEDSGQRGWHMYMTPPDAARGLWLLNGLAVHNPDLPNDHVDISGYKAFQTVKDNPE